MKTKTITCWLCDAKFEATVEDFACFPSECPTCRNRRGDRDRAEFQKKKELSAEAVEKHIEKITPAAFRKTDAGRLPPDQHGKIMGWQYGPKGLLLIGPSGRGKTRCLWLLAHSLLRAGRKVEFLRETDFSHQVARRGYIGTLWDWVDYLSRVEILILDDLGKAPRTDRFVSELFHIVDTRLNDEMPILISTQLDGEAVGEQIHSVHTAEALVRRLREACEVVRFDIEKQGDLPIP